MPANSQVGTGLLERVDTRKWNDKKLNPRGVQKNLVLVLIDASQNAI